MKQEDDLRLYELLLDDLEKKLDVNNPVDMVWKEGLEDKFGYLAQAHLIGIHDKDFRKLGSQYIQYVALIQCYLKQGEKQ